MVKLRIGVVVVKCLIGACSALRDSVKMIIISSSAATPLASARSAHLSAMALATAGRGVPEPRDRCTPLKVRRSLGWGH